MRYCLLLTVLLPCILKAGGPWAQEKGHGYSELSLTSGFSSWVVDLTIQGYAEVGFGNKLTGKLIVPVKFVSTKLDRDNEFVPASIGTASLWGPGNIVAGLAYELYKKKVVLAAKIDIWGQTIISDDTHGLRTGYDRWSFRPTFAIGQGYSKFYWYIDIYTDLATNGYSHGLGAIAELGYVKQNNFSASLYIQYVQSFNNGSFNESQAAAYQLTGFFVDDEYYVNIGAKLSKTIKHGWGISGGLFRIFTLRDGSGILTGKLGVFKVL